MSIGKSKTKVFMIFVAMLAMNGFGQQSTITFNVDQAKVVVPNEVFGLLMERLGRQWDGQGAIFVGTSSTIKNVNGMRQDVIDGFVECGVGAAQWPGGCAANGYSWSDNKTPSNAVGVDRFIQFCKLTGAEAVISLKPATTDVASNLAFAQYIINDLKYPLKWVKIGNEIWGGCGTSYTNGYTTGTFPQNFAKLKDLRGTDNGKDLKIIAAAGSTEGGYSWIPTYYTQIGQQMDAIEYHDYIFRTSWSSSNPSTSNYWQIMNDIFVGDFHGHLFNNIVPAMKAADPTNRVKIDFDEWGDWLQGDNWMQTITVMDAISAAGHLNQFIQNADVMGVACLAQGVNVIHSIININTSGVMVKTPAFYVFKMYKPHHAKGAKYCPMTASNFEQTNSVPIGNATATVDSTGAVNVSFTNVDLTAERKVVVTLTSTHAPYKILSAEVITGATYTTTNPFGGAENVNIQVLPATSYTVDKNILTVTLPSKSVVMIRVIPVSVSTAKPARVLNNKTDAYTVKSGARGTVVVSSSINRQTPITIGLYGSDGRALINQVTRTPGAGAMVIGSNLNRGVYLVKITDGTVSLMKQAIVTK